MPLWQMFEVEALDYIGVGGTFTAYSLSDRLGITPTEASEWTQRYLTAQRGQKSRTKYILTRQGRTSAAVWTVGRRVQDARVITAQFASDMKRRITRAVEPDLARIGQVNPQARRQIESGLSPIVDSLVGVVAGVLRTFGWEDEK